MTERTPLPIEPLLPRIAESLSRSENVLVAAPPGSGKTTRIPIALQTEAWLQGKKTLVLQPRRIAVQSVAQHMAALSGLGDVGDYVGYRVRFDTRVSAATRIEVISEAILVRMLQEDPSISEVGLIIFDEIHERSIASDLGLVFALDVQETLRPDLRLLLMSATVDSSVFSECVPNLTTHCGGSPPYPVAKIYLGRDSTKRLADHVAAVIPRVYEETEGDLLVFLPGIKELTRVQQVLVGGEYPVQLLHGGLSFKEQQAIIRRSEERRVLLATSIAETSLTIEGVGVVIDSGMQRVSRFDSRIGFDRLHTERVTQDTAEQRAGRAGRVGPGICYRLWSESEVLRKNRAPQIVDADITGLALEVSIWGGVSKWITPPADAALQSAFSTLESLRAVDSNQHPTKHGRELARSGTHPRIASMLKEAHALGLSSVGSIVAALVENHRTVGTISISLSERIRAVFRKDLPLREIRLQAERFNRGPLLDVDYREEQLARIVLAGFADCIAQRSATMAYGTRYVLRKGGSCEIPNTENLTSQFVIALRLAGGGTGLVGSGSGLTGSELRVELAMELDQALLEEYCSDQMSYHRVAFWDESDVLRCQERKQLGYIVLTTTSARLDLELKRQHYRERLTKAGGMQILAGAESLIARCTLARQHVGGEGIVEALDAAFSMAIDRLVDTSDNWRAFLDGPLESCVLDSLGWDLRQQLNSVCPKEIPLPSGRMTSVTYDERGPMIEVRIQDAFGWANTPLVGPFVPRLALLAPNNRPLQITSDLDNFWRTTYPEVRKEMRGRYPKHYWPEDACSAEIGKRLSKPK